MIVHSACCFFFLFFPLNLLYCVPLYCTVYHYTILSTIILYCLPLYCTVYHYTVLSTIILHCVPLYCTVDHYTVLSTIILYCVPLYCTVYHYTVLCTIILYCVPLYCTVYHYIVLWTIILYCVLFIMKALKTTFLCPLTLFFYRKNLNSWNFFLKTDKVKFFLKIANNNPSCLIFAFSCIYLSQERRMTHTKARCALYPYRRKGWFC